MDRILVIDDDHEIRKVLCKYLSSQDYLATQASGGREAIELVRNTKFNIVLCDFKLPDDNGLDLIRKIKVLDPDCIIIMITGHSDVKVAVSAMKYGAYSFLAKPIQPDELMDLIKEALNSAKSNDLTTEERNSFSSDHCGDVDAGYVTGTSTESKLVQKYIELIAPTDISVVILGETGTGKVFVAKAIHDRSDRKNRPFIAVDCGALPEELAGSELFGHIKGAFTGALRDKPGQFELADRGTMFLDEIGNLSYENQIKLLRVLQEKKIKRIGSNQEIHIDVRLITATNLDLSKAVQSGKFREDLFFRLNEFLIQIQPLRKRKRDIILFAQHFLDLANRSLSKEVTGFNQEALEKINNYYWYGNLRELKNVIKRAVLFCSGREISANCLPEEIINPQYFKYETNGAPPNFDSADLRSIVEKAERNLIIETMTKMGNNKSKTAKILDIDRRTLYNKLTGYNIVT